jgi:hypothetical protein
MKTTAQRRLARFTGLVLLSLLVVAAGVQVAQAATSSTTPAAGTQGRGGVAVLATTAFAGTEGRGGVAFRATAPSAGTQGRGGVAFLTTTSSAATAQSAVTQGRGGVAGLATAPSAGTQGRGGVAALSTTSSAGTQGSFDATAFTRGRGGIASVRGVTAAQPGLSGTPSTTSWIIFGSALAALMIGVAAWALISRRRQRDEPLSVAFCAQHPEHAMCGTA